MRNDRAERETGHFNKLASEYEELFGLNQPVALYKVKNLCLEYVEFLKDAPLGPILEIGSGTGFYTRHLAFSFTNREYLATDISEEMLSIAKSSCSKIENKHITWQVENCLDSSFKNNSISIITGHGILHHLPVENSIKEMERILKPGGRIAFYEPNILNPYVWMIKTIPKMRPKGDTPDETALNPFRVKKILKKYGFKNIKIVPYEIMLNGISPNKIPLFSKISFIISKIPIFRYFLGGSLKITAIYK